MSKPAPLSVLIVEDNRDGADSLAELLSLHGHTVRVARTAAEARAAGPLDVAILDIGLPDGSGFDLAEVFAALDPRPLLVAVTGYPNLDGKSRSVGIDHHLVKPFDPARLADLLRGYAGR